MARDGPAHDLIAAVNQPTGNAMSDATLPTASSEALQRVRDSFARQNFMTFIGARICSLSAGSCEIELPFRLELGQQHGYFHGGLVGTLADNASGYAAFTLIPLDATVLTVEFKINLLAPGLGDRLIGRSKVVKAGRTLSVCHADVLADRQGQQTLCATALVTLMTLPGRADGPAP
jgi:uncharacterized protein (TIGR00369 family)